MEKRELAVSATRVMNNSLPTLLFRLANDQRRTTNDEFLQIPHLNCSHRRLEPFVPHLQPSTINRLLKILASEHPECMRHSRLLRRLPNSPRNFVDDHVVMRRVPANQTAQTDDGVVFPSLRQGTRRRRNFKRSRHADNINIFLACARTHQPVIGAAQQAVGNKFVEPRDHDPKAKPRCVQLPGARLPPNFLGDVLLVVSRMCDFLCPGASPHPVPFLCVPQCALWLGFETPPQRALR